MDDSYALVPGCRFSVHHGRGNSTEGILKGVSVMGGITALVFELDDGTVRYINQLQVEYMDRIGEPPAEEEPPKSFGNVYYG